MADHGAGSSDRNRRKFDESAYFVAYIGPAKKKPTIVLIAGSLMPIRLFLAPRPGLEPGTYGLTVRRSTD